MLRWGSGEKATCAPLQFTAGYCDDSLIFAGVLRHRELHFSIAGGFVDFPALERWESVGCVGRDVMPRGQLPSGRLLSPSGGVKKFLEVRTVFRRRQGGWG